MVDPEKVIELLLDLLGEQEGVEITYTLDLQVNEG